ncbi:related to cellulose-binding GDSL lipase/acylhydrolase [Cephalotrichum gorgonifer]|uniref:Related to cellulose-binding GDSL lipase/acylhydrolase n=1 Tax=Cephalotrichum gorgonifer TaxID=2041049 RepID=A0AAE8SZE6_9PEZI|nr:related to cellulose-binding GDSL lipase/acylhydrolase [Cephalotrichum gorgonifer]
MAAGLLAIITVLGFIAAPGALADPTCHFVTFGSSTTQTGFKSNLTWPSASNPLGNPSLPGWTTSGGLNWLGFDITEFNRSATFVDQVDDFEVNLAKKPTPWNSRNLLIGIWIANNDVGGSWNEPDLPEFYEQVSAKYFEQVQRLYNLGARQFVLLTCAPQETTPLMRTNGADLTKLAAAVELYNDVMARNLQVFKKTHRDPKGWLVHTANAYHEAMDHPEKYGAPDDICENLDSVSCLWWNNYHPGVAIHRLLGAGVAKVVGRPWFHT